MRVFDWTITNSPRPSFSCGKASATILAALPDSPTPASCLAMVFIGDIAPMANAAITKASQPKIAVLRWVALQRPARAARLRGRFGSPLDGGLPDPP